MADSIETEKTFSKTQIVERVVESQRKHPDADRKKWTPSPKARSTRMHKPTDRDKHQEEDTLLLSEERQHKDESQDSEDEEQNTTALNSQDPESNKGQTLDLRA